MINFNPNRGCVAFHTKRTVSQDGHNPVGVGNLCVPRFSFIVFAVSVLEIRELTCVCLLESCKAGTTPLGLEHLVCSVPRVATKRGNPGLCDITASR